MKVIFTTHFSYNCIMDLFGNKVKQAEGRKPASSNFQPNGDQEYSVPMDDRRTNAHDFDNPQQIANNSPQIVQLMSYQKMARNAPNRNFAVQLKQIEQYRTKDSRVQDLDPGDKNLQKKAEGTSAKVNNTGLPDNLKSGVENISGVSMADVKVHYNSEKPAQMQAHAFAQGTDIHMGPGEEKHLAHEAWHVVQQKQGRVEPTMQLKGAVGVNDDAGLEHEADLMGAKAADAGNDVVVQSKSGKASSNDVHNPRKQDRRPLVEPTQLKSKATIQRLPNRFAVVAAVGPPKAKEGKSETYKALLNALDSYGLTVGMFIANNPAGIAQQQNDIHASIDLVIAKAHEYYYAHARDKDDRVKFIKGILDQAYLEKRVVNTRATYYTNNPPQGQFFWSQALPKDLGTHVKELTDKTEIRKASGALNTVGEHKLSDSYSGYFKEDKATVSAGTEADLAGDLGIPANNPKFANRSLAMYRVDQLLGSNVIAKTEEATGGKKGKSKGTISEKVVGARLGEAGAPSVSNPQVQRFLSKLEMIDAICFQIDRHAGNMFLQLDDNGQVIGAKGIDNDLAFASRDKDPANQPGHKNLKDFKSVDTQKQEFWGVSRHFDRDTAEMVLALDPTDIEAVLIGLLSDKEIDYAIARLKHLKIKILEAKGAGRLLAPDQWNAATAAAQKVDNTGYVAKWM